MTASTSAGKPKHTPKQQPEAQAQPAEYVSTDKRAISVKLQYISNSMSEGDLLGIVTAAEIAEAINVQFRAPRNLHEFKGWEDLSVEECDYLILMIDSRKQGKE